MIVMFKVVKTMITHNTYIKNGHHHHHHYLTPWRQMCAYVLKDRGFTLVKCEKTKRKTSIKKQFVRRHNEGNAREKIGDDCSFPLQSAVGYECLHPDHEFLQTRHTTFSTLNSRETNIKWTRKVRQGDMRWIILVRKNNHEQIRICYADG